MRYHVRTLMILLFIMPPLIAVCWAKYSTWLEIKRAEAEWQRAEAIRIYRVTDPRLPVPPLPNP